MEFVVLTNYCHLFHLPFKHSLSSSSSLSLLVPLFADMDISKAEGKRSMKDRMKEDVVKEDEEDEDTEEDNKKKRAITHSGRKVSGGGSATLCCQVEDCMANMSDAKAYHRRHKVCELHAKAPVVRIAGLQQRFCQQCSRLGNCCTLFMLFIDYL